MFTRPTACLLRNRTTILANYTVRQQCRTYAKKKSKNGGPRIVKMVEDSRGRMKEEVKPKEMPPYRHNKLKEEEFTIEDPDEWVPPYLRDSSSKGGNRSKEDDLLMIHEVGLDEIDIETIEVSDSTSPSSTEPAEKRNQTESDVPIRLQHMHVEETRNSSDTSNGSVSKERSSKSSTFEFKPTAKEDAPSFFDELESKGSAPKHGTPFFEESNSVPQPPRKIFNEPQPDVPIVKPNPTSGKKLPLHDTRTPEERRMHSHGVGSLKSSSSETSRYVPAPVVPKIIPTHTRITFNDRPHQLPRPSEVDIAIPGLTRSHIPHELSRALGKQYLSRNLEPVPKAKKRLGALYGAEGHKFAYFSLPVIAVEKLKSTSVLPKGEADAKLVHFAYVPTCPYTFLSDDAGNTIVGPGWTSKKYQDEGKECYISGRKVVCYPAGEGTQTGNVSILGADYFNRNPGKVSIDYISGRVQINFTKAKEQNDD